ncbi:trp region conserved hypothetical membrane protein [Nocardioides exalbidus]|uniref:Trp region conserved hypothetical membrane protein n=1 Tax=Nocardioides exalbidus TaxID=402596 RepID=A0A1H4X8Z7_9ACTN|nr:Trp biosynthesis-associated membrane protein [Nocardioides exalbidus]SED01174.1 trp region conserved hypothetical membrane protein [Nocardioides exalbidus]
MAEVTRGPRRTFGPVVLLGLAGAGAAAVAGSKPWVVGSSGNLDSRSEATVAIAGGSIGSSSESPLALALALVVLACWGVVLVSRGRFRRVVAVLALVASLGVAATVVEGISSLPTKLAETLVELSGSDTASTSFTAWYAAAAVGAVLSVLATAAAVRLVPSWPEMGTKYDAPTGGAAGDGHDDGGLPADNIDIWKALDEGRDPTA